MELSEEELKRIENEGCGCAMYLPECVARDLVAEVRRLRGLLKRAEWAGYHECLGGDEGVCPWCDVEKVMGPIGQPPGQHEPSCPAFTTKGDAR